MRAPAHVYLLAFFLMSFGLSHSEFSHAKLSHPAISSLSGRSIVDSKPFQVDLSKKTLVLVFLSAECPCSDSHTSEIASLSRDFPNFQFVGIHSNTDEGEELTTKYFQKVQLPFPVLQDTRAKIADQFKAYKTPHAFVISSDGSILYQGGVSDSRHIEDAQQKYLRTALTDLTKGQKIKNSETRTLGCVISRKGKYVW